MRAARLDTLPLALTKQQLDWILARASAMLRVTLHLGLPATLFSYWLALGTRFYELVVPFYDSMAYQERYFTVLEQALAGGVASVLGVVAQPSNSLAYYVVTAVLARVLPQSVAGFYLVIFAFAAAALAIVVRSVARLTTSLMATAVLYLLLGCGAGRLLSGGILDQRLDFVAGFLLVAVAASVWLAIEAPGDHSNWLVAGIAIAMAVLQRPVSAAQIACLAIAFLITRPRAVLRALRAAGAHGWIAFAGPVLAAISITAPSLDYLRYYYFQWNTDVGRAASIGDSLTFAAWSGIRHVGRLVGLVVLASIMMAIAQGRWKQLFRMAAVIGALWLPYVASRSAGNQLVLIGPALSSVLIAVVPARAPAINASWAVIALFIGLAATVWNASSLYSQVMGIDRAPRLQLERIVDQLTMTPAQLALSGIDPSIGAINHLDRFHGQHRLIAGPRFFHAPDFGLDKVPQTLDQAAWAQVDTALTAICSYPGYVVVLAPEFKDDPTAYLFTYRLGSEISARIRALPCVHEALTAYTDEGRPLVVHRVG
jgi:hypothetical protein